MEQQSMKDMYQLKFGEEVANCVTHGVMALLCLFALPCVAVYGYIQAGTLKAIGDSIFVISLFLMFIVSTLYHSMPFGTTHKYVFRKLDHICIYFAIAGSYTPIALTVIGGTKGFVIIAIEWLAVLGGILLKSISSHSYPKLSMTIYMIMGWIAVLFIPDLIRSSSLPFLALIVGGGLMYTIGAFFYRYPQKKYFHSIWHVCINIASLFHFIAIIFLI
ncbi:PAQR family membrane homeostasis protein TrhA [[Eubacterium] hominis]|uniref:PAQR family membrane homeostasis protein TrhA n=1 Tax=[Eubacterium] hominis TaxID=2764325 RepID=UPI003A4D3E2E